MDSSPCVRVVDHCSLQTATNVLNFNRKSQKKKTEQCRRSELDLPVDLPVFGRFSGQLTPFGPFSFSVEFYSKHTYLLRAATSRAALVLSSSRAACSASSAFALAFALTFLPQLARPANPHDGVYSSTQIVMEPRTWYR